MLLAFNRITYYYCIEYILDSSTLRRLLQGTYSEAKLVLEGVQSQANNFTLAADIWTKKAWLPFLGISCCFFNYSSNKVYHVLLNLHRISHPHTGTYDCNQSERDGGKLENLQRQGAHHDN